MQRREQSGFTLVEMIVSIILLGIIAGMLAPVIKTNIDAYSDTQSRSHLLDKVRVSLGRLSRELRQGTVSTTTASGSTLEFYSSTVGGRYVSFNASLPRIANADCSKKRNQSPSELERFLPGEPIGTLCVLYPGDLGGLAATKRDALIIGRDVVAVTDITAQLSAAPPASDEYDGALWKLDLNCPTPPDNDCTFSSTSTSALNTYSLADYQHRVSLDGTTLQWQRTVASADDFSAADQGILLNNVSSFTTSLDTQKGVVSVHLTVAEGSESISVSEDIYVRN
ncbi:prepilin-type N-terminal cleavage/methylation domain-containing protein [Thiohalomonas denitrificans]|uniref:Prepilin-type N-terminal cleavage/methylation domain-containing protein n=1 Tax=Thiohalomonas denitrificans TaxID=415747 RepID=A0A1G5QTG3_9GAMM|nr:prepilin-type N-terminal cleavage/methylation domain-containing protein [Thiohalomonas denitrificans]SCZ65174.1 prepilin-type N-terminal cleavage/methylation domain-containing protein [Thiohalomonas denitrificans]